MEKHSLATKLTTFLKEGIIRLWDKYHRYPRYFVVIPAEITIIKSDIVFNARIVNISKTGVFLEADHEVEDDANMNIKFMYKDIEYIFTARKIGNHAIISSQGIGVKFLFDKFYSYQREIVSNFIEVLEAQDPPVPKS